MKKGLFILFMLLIVPCFIDATCNNDIHDKLKDEAKNITHSINYDSSSKRFKVIFENVSEGMYVNSSGIKHNQKNNTVEIGNLSEGTNMVVFFYGNDGCDGEIDIRRINIPYKNDYYKSALCDGYEDKLTMCHSEFLNVKTSKELILSAIENYENAIPVYEPPKEEIIIEPTLLEKAIDFAEEWGLKIGLSIGSSIITILIGSILYRKELHGV